MSATPDRLIAGLVGDRYEITGLIASGGMGSVYRARDTVLDRVVALKVLKAGGDDPEFVAKFKAEATNAARLSHPNIVAVYDFGYTDGSPYMAMEFVDGQTLRQILGARGRLSGDLAARIAAQVAGALEHARRAGLAHRDIKPENILITTDGMVKVADFGLSRAFAESKATQAGMLVGTAHYLAPEQVQGAHTDHRADIYSLGVVIFEMLTGRTPFTGDSPVVVAYKRVAEDVPSVLSLNPEAPRELDMIVARATERDPDARFATAGVMAEALRAAAPRSDTGEIGALVHHTQAIPILGEETIAVKRPVDPTGGATKTKRHRKRWLVLAVLMALIATAVWAANGPLTSIAVPHVVGQTQSQAKAAIEARGLRVDVSLDSSSTVPAGRVIAQDPTSGTLHRDDVVRLTVSTGPEFISIPSVVGMKFAAAEDQLKAAGFKVRREDVFNEKPRLTVIGQDPKGFAEKDTLVTLTVSKGPELVTVPDVVGDPVDTAATDLRAAGFEVTITRVFDDKVEADHVIKQSPVDGTKVSKGATIALTVSKGPALVAVPRIICMTRNQATEKLAEVGLKIDFSGSGKKVVDQEPVPGDKIPKGSAVIAYLGSGITTCR
jgi:eukaryotic-like serine/threonine-protein kinase